MGGSLGQKFKFNGKEMVDDLELGWYDYGWRHYSPELGRWMNPDLLAEEYLDHSPYAYTMNNPIKYIDVDGLYSTAEWMEDNGITEDDLITVYQAPDEDSGSDESDTGDCCDGIGETIKAGVMSAFGFASNKDVQKIAETNPEKAAQISEKNAKAGDDRNEIAQAFADGLATGDLLGISTLVAGLQDGVSVGDAVNVATILPLGKGLKLLKAARSTTSLWPAASSGRAIINGIEYTTHALERMQPVGTIMLGNNAFSRGVPPSVVENAIRYGTVTLGNTSAEAVRTFENVRVITNRQGTRVISVIKTGH